MNKSETETIRFNEQAMVAYEKTKSLPALPLGIRLLRVSRLSNAGLMPRREKKI